MSDFKLEQPTATTIRTKSIETVQAMKVGPPGESSPPTTPSALKKRRPSARLIALISLGAIAVIACLLWSAPAERRLSLGIAVCAIASGGFLIRHVVRGMEEEELQEDQLEANQITVSPSESNLSGQKLNPTPPPSKPKQNTKYGKENL